MPLAYEWVAEIVIDDEITDSDYYPINDLDAALAWGRYTVECTPHAGLRVGLVRYVFDAEGAERNRDYAYAEDGELAETFEDSARDVPARFRAAYRRAPARPLPVPRNRS